MDLIYDIHSFGNDSIVFLVKHRLCEKKYEVQDPFYMEVDKKNKDVLSEFDIEYENRDWRDVDNNPTYSIPYTSFNEKSQILKLCAKRGVDVFNSDISEARVWQIKNGYEMGNITDDILFFDIEVDPRGIKENMDSKKIEERYANRIIGIGFVNQRGDRRFIIDRDEREMLRKAYAYASSYTGVSGWYSRTFDMPYLVGRSELLGVKLPWDRMGHMDMAYSYSEFMKFNKDLGEVVYKGLDYVSNRYLGYGKVDIGGYDKLVDMFENDWFALENYCIQDVALLLDLYNEVDGIREKMIVEGEKARMTFTRPTEMYRSSYVDNLLFMFAYRQKIAIPRQYDWRHRYA